MSSIKSIEPLISANSAVTVLRSPTLESGSGLSRVTRIAEAAGVADTLDRCSTSALSDAAHSAQNRAPGGFSNPHRSHRRLNGAAHWMQNFAPSGFSAEQFWQRIEFQPNSRLNFFVSSDLGQRHHANVDLAGSRTTTTW